MNSQPETRNSKLALRSLAVLISVGIILVGCKSAKEEPSPEEVRWNEFLIQKEDLNLNYQHASGERKLSFANYKGSADEWKQDVLSKYAELIDYREPDPGPVRFVREMEQEGVLIKGYIMTISDRLSIHAYLLEPADGVVNKSTVMGIHGHGRVEPAIGMYDDYHHMFGWELAKAGHRVLCPELRGFSKLNNLAHDDTLNCLDYWEGRWQFTLATDCFLYGKSMVGETVEDLIRWEKWLINTFGTEKLDVCGISYGGDLTICYPVFSTITNRIFCSGSMGSFSWIFRSCYNAPAHCIPGVLEWMDRSDIAGLLAPRPIFIHYGELDTPSPENASAANNPSGPVAFEELREIYQAFGAPDDVLTYYVTPDTHHEMDIARLLAFFE